MAIDKAIFQAALGQICAFRTQGDTSVEWRKRHSPVKTHNQQEGD